MLTSLPEYKSARSISVFLSMPASELSTRKIVEHALKDGKSVLVPYLYKNPQPGQPKSLMDMVKLHSEEDFHSLKADKWGIPTPEPSSRAHCLEGHDSQQNDQQPISRMDLEMMVVPGVAFDHKLQRLGHGRGYYDHFLSRYQARLQSSVGSQENMPFLGRSVRHLDNEQ